MTLAQAQLYAAKIVDWLRDKTVRIEIAGSIRRDRPVCNDVDIVCIPKIEEKKDLFQIVVGQKNHLFDFMFKYIIDPANTAKGVKGISSGRNQMVVQLPKCQLDLWYADEKNLASRLLCRTGSMQHNIWLASRAKRKGWKWNSYEGILTDGRWIETAAGDDYAGGHLNQFATEEEIYRFLDLPFIEPKNRELDYLIKNFGQ